MQRRTFLCQLTLGTALAALPAGLARATRRPAPDARQRWAELLDYARWAPSPHNIQPWRLRVVSETAAEVYYEPGRLLPCTDPTSRFTVVGLSMFVECLRLAAGPLGLALTARPAPEPQLNFGAVGPQLFATLTLAPDPPTPAADRELIRQRRTSRLHYDGREIPAPVQRRLAAIATAHGHTLTFAAAPATVDFVLDLNRQTVFTDLDDPAARGELAAWIRTTDQEAATKKDGLWSHCMRFPGRLMHNFFFHPERFRQPWKRKILGEVYAQSMRGTRTVAWLQGPFGGRPDWEQAGTMLEQLWLELTRHGLYLHPFGSVITNAAAYAQFCRHVGHPTTAEPIWLLVRLGYSQEPPRSFRLTVNDILIPENV